MTSVHLPAVNTTQFDWARTKRRAKPRPVAPVYSTRTAANAILHAAAHPQREYWLGGSTVMTILGALALPSFMDRYLSRGVVEGQDRDQKTSPNREDNLNETVEGLHDADGSFDDEAREGAFLFPATDTLVAVAMGALLAAGADVSKVGVIRSMITMKGDKQRAFSIADDIPRLRATMRMHPDIQVIVIDPVNSFTGTSREHDSFRDSDVRAVLNPLKAFAEEFDVAVILVTHFRKGNGKAMKAVDLVMGSLAFVALSRSAWAFIGETDDLGHATGRRFMARIKQNVAKPTDAIAYDVVGEEVTEGISAPKIAWGELFRHLMRHREMIEMATTDDERQLLIEDFEDNLLGSSLEFSAMRRDFWEAYKPRDQEGEAD